MDHGQIRGLGITHYPNLASKVNMTWRFQKALEDPTVHKVFAVFRPNGSR